MLRGRRRVRGKRLLQRIGVFVTSLDAENIGGICRRRDVRCGRIGTSSLGERLLFGARARQRSDQPVIPLEAPGFGVDSIRLVALLSELLLDGPWFGPRRRILD